MPSNLSSADYSQPLRPVAQAWVDKIQVAKSFKKEFDDEAATAMKYLKGPYDFIWQGRGSKPGKFVDGDLDDLPPPSHRVSANKAYEYKAIYGPVLYNRNPVFTVTPRRMPEIPPEVFGNPQDPQFQQQFMMAAQQQMLRETHDRARAMLIGSYINYIPNETDLKLESRMMVDEALIKGMGVLWHTTWTPPGSQMTMPFSEWCSSDDIVLDPDANRIRDCRWVARRYLRPRWDVEAEFGLPERTLPGTYESGDAQGSNLRRRGAKNDRNKGQTYDIQEYWEVFSMVGFGHRLRGIEMPADVSALCESFGPYCRVVVAEGVPFPLNMHSAWLMAEDDQAAFMRSQWPIPFWYDDRMPFSYAAFNEIAGQLYPSSPLTPGMGELKFISWCMSYLASKIRTTCRDFIAIAKSAGEELKNKILHGTDLSLLEIERVHGSISNVVSFLQHPNFNGDIWRVLEAVVQQWELRVGMTPLMYGMSPVQMRSAQEAQIKGSQTQVRPDDMAQRVEDTMSDVARCMAMTARWSISDQQVEPILGPLGAAAWRQLIMQADLSQVARELEYRVEAGSMKKPNHSMVIENMQGAMNLWLPHLLGFGSRTGNFAPANALMRDWSKAVGMDPDAYMIPNLPPPPPPGADQQGGPPQQPPKANPS